jgi:hypothetical protein
MADLIWVIIKDSKSVLFGLGHMCHNHARLFDLEHISYCDHLDWFQTSPSVPLASGHIYEISISEDVGQVVTASEEPASVRSTSSFFHKSAATIVVSI